jgi:Mg2+-importing ATPase
MSLLPHSILPRNFKHADASIQVSPRLLQAVAAEHDQVFAALKTGESGLSEAEARRRLTEYGPNAVGGEQHFTRSKLLIKACLNPLVILLSVLATITFATAQGWSDLAGGVLMVIMVVLGVSLRFLQEARADAAAAKLKAMIHVTATVVRDGKEREIPLAELVPGDVIRLAAGNMIPADIRLLACRDCFLLRLV